METQTIGVSENRKNFRIRLSGKETEFSGTDAELWQHIDGTLMPGAADGALPHVEEIKDAPAQLVTSAPASAIPATSTAIVPTAAPKTHAEAKRNGVSVEGAARSTTDLLAAQAAGFAPARPLYDRGTPVIALGVENARASHRTWEKQPRLQEAVAKFCEHVKAENRRDELIGIDQLMMFADGTLTGARDERWLIEPEAMAQLASRLGVPSAGYLVNVWPQLRSLNWNQLVATAVKHEKSTCPKEHELYGTLDSLQTVRARMRDAEGKPSVWAVVSDSYATFDVDQIARALALGLAKYPEARCEVTYDGRGAQFDVLFHSDVQPEKYVAGEFFKVGYRVRTSDAGGGSIKVSVLLWQNLCLNLLCIDVASFVLANLRHIGDSHKLAAKFRDAVKAGEQRIGHFLRAWNFATDDSLANDAHGRLVVSDRVRLLDEMPSGDTFTEAELLAGVFAGLGKADLVSIGKDDITGLVAAHALDTSSARAVVPVTRASVVNAITRYAHETVGRIDPRKQAMLESEAGALLIGGRGGEPAALPFMPPRKLQTVA